MKNVWWTIVTFLRKLFVPPEFTALEHELLRQVSHLEGELHRQRDKYEELTQRLLFPSAQPVIEQGSVNFSVSNSVPPPRERAKQLSELSRLRYLEKADRIVAEAEERMRNRGKEASEESPTEVGPN